MLKMASYIPQLTILLSFFVSFTSALVFTNSFDGWVGNSTYFLTWIPSNSDPMYYDLTLARPYSVQDAGVVVDGSWPMEWSTTIAAQSKMLFGKEAQRSDDRFARSPFKWRPFSQLYDPSNSLAWVCICCFLSFAWLTTLNQCLLLGHAE